MTEITKKEGNPVRQGEILAVMDDRSYRLRVERLAAELAAMTKEKESREIELSRLKQETVLNEQIASGRIDRISKQVAVLKARADALKAVIEQLSRDRQRYETLLREKAVPRREAEQIETRLRAKAREKRAVEEEMAALEVAKGMARKQLDLAVTRRLNVKETEKAVQAMDEKIKALSASLEQARQDLAECVLKSPIDGRVAKRHVSAGAVVSPKKAILSLVDPEDLYVLALLEENKLNGVSPGADVKIRIDAYPDSNYSGRVQEILPASAATFALVPRDISAGEFTKVAQRIPVRIRITSGNLSLLRVGLGGEVEIKRQ